MMISWYNSKHKNFTDLQSKWNSSVSIPEINHPMYNYDSDFDFRFHNLIFVIDESKTNSEDFDGKLVKFSMHDMKYTTLVNNLVNPSDVEVDKLNSIIYVSEKTKKGRILGFPYIFDTDNGLTFVKT